MAASERGSKRERTNLGLKASAQVTLDKMADNFLVPETKIEANGAGPALALGPSAGRTLLLTLGITKILEQQSLDVSIWGSVDGSDWGPKPLLSFPQKFYVGSYTLLLDLSDKPEIQFLQARWTVNRWGVGSTKPMFLIYIFVEVASGVKTA